MTPAPDAVAVSTSVFSSAPIEAVAFSVWPSLVMMEKKAQSAKLTL